MYKPTRMPWESKRYVKRRIPIRAMQINEPFEVKTMEGVFIAKAGDYLIEGIKGELYSCDRKIFEESYVEERYEVIKLRIRNK